MGTRDRVRLSVQERKELATIEAMVEAGDPELATALTTPLRPWGKLWRRLRSRWSVPLGARPPRAVSRARRALCSALGAAWRWAARRLPARLRRARVRAKWLGPVLVVFGLGAVFGTISIATWLSLLGVVVVALGLGLWLVAWRRSVPPRPARQSHEAPTN